MIANLIAIEIKKILFYRGDLLVRLLWSTVVRILLGYYLWVTIFSSNQAQVIGGYTFDQMILYYVLSALAANAILLPIGFISRDIYDGSLTKYLVLPRPFLLLRAAYPIANCTIGILQIGVGLLIWNMLFGASALESMSILSFLEGVGTLYLSVLLYYSMIVSIELLALWVEQAASLSLMIMFMINFLGGIFLPISVFPDWAQRTLMLSPFPYLAYVPAEIVRGEFPIHQVFMSWGIIVMWFLVFMVIAHLLWRKGSYQYSGVGM